MATNIETANEPHKTFDTILVLDFGSVYNSCYMKLPQILTATGLSIRI